MRATKVILLCAKYCYPSGSHFDLKIAEINPPKQVFPVKIKHIDPHLFDTDAAKRSLPIVNSLLLSTRTARY